MQAEKAKQCEETEKAIEVTRQDYKHTEKAIKNAAEMAVKKAQKDGANSTGIQAVLQVYQTSEKAVKQAAPGSDVQRLNAVFQA